MSKQNKQRRKALARKIAKESNRKGPPGASGLPSRQMPPPWVGGGTRKPKAVKEREAKLKAALEAAAREHEKQALREVADAH